MLWGLKSKLRVHSITLKHIDGKAQLFWKQFMRDTELQPRENEGWPLFFKDVLDRTELQIMPTKPISGFDKVQEHVEVSLCKA